MEKKMAANCLSYSAKGVQMTDIDKPAPDDAKLPSHTETEKVLKELDKEIPFSGRI